MGRPVGIGPGMGQGQPRRAAQHAVMPLVMEGRHAGIKAPLPSRPADDPLDHHAAAHAANPRTAIPPAANCRQSAQNAPCPDSFPTHPAAPPPAGNAGWSAAPGTGPNALRATSAPGRKTAEAPACRQAPGHPWGRRQRSARSRGSAACPPPAGRISCQGYAGYTANTHTCSCRNPRSGSDLSPDDVASSAPGTRRNDGAFRLIRHAFMKSGATAAGCARPPQSLLSIRESSGMATTASSGRVREPAALPRPRFPMPSM